jgi:hypothetical protein
MRHVHVHRKPLSQGSDSGALREQGQHRADDLFVAADSGRRVVELRLKLRCSAGRSRESQRSWQNKGHAEREGPAQTDGRVEQPAELRARRDI